MKPDHRTLALLRNSPLLQALNPNQFDRLMCRARLHTLKEGDFLFHQSDPLEEIYICIDGCTKLFRLTPNGDEKIIDIISPGHSFAEAVMFFGEQRYPVHAVAIKFTQVVGINANQYLEIIQSSRELTLNMLGLMSRRMHWLLNEVDRLTLHNATFRLAAFLLEMRDCISSGQSICLGTPKHVIASRLSIKPETFSRILKRLSDQGLISIRDQHIELLDIPALEAIVQTEV